jgi:hypothetical protein
MLSVHSYASQVQGGTVDFIDSLKGDHHALALKAWIETKRYLPNVLERPVR